MQTNIEKLMEKLRTESNAKHIVNMFMRINVNDYIYTVNELLGASSPFRPLRRLRIAVHRPKIIRNFPNPTMMTVIAIMICFLMMMTLMTMMTMYTTRPRKPHSGR